MFFKLFPTASLVYFFSATTLSVVAVPVAPAPGNGNDMVPRTLGSYPVPIKFAFDLGNVERPTLYFEYRTDHYYGFTVAGHKSSGSLSTVQFTCSQLIHERPAFIGQKVIRANFKDEQQWVNVYNLLAGKIGRLDALNNGRSPPIRNAMSFIEAGMIYMSTIDGPGDRKVVDQEALKTWEEEVKPKLLKKMVKEGKTVIKTEPDSE